MTVTSSALSLSDPQFWRLPIALKYEHFRWLRDTSPVSLQPPPFAWSSDRFPEVESYWAVTSHALVREVSRNPSTFASGRGISWFPSVPAELASVWEGFIGLDSPEHNQLRSVVAQAFRPKSVDALRERIQFHVVQTLSTYTRGDSADFLRDIVGPVPLHVICEMMGTSKRDAEYLFGLMDRMNGTGESATSFDASLAAAQEMTEFAIALAAHKRRFPSDDVMTRMVSSSLDGRKLTDAELGGTFVVVVTGGIDTVSNTAAHALEGFRQFPRQWRNLVESPTTPPLAIEEMLRWATPVRHFRRTATQPYDLGGQNIEAGDHVVIWYESANRDEAVFDAPNTFDLDRVNNPHLAFGGGGPHACLGQHLARLELQIIFDEITERFPNARLADAPTYADSPFINTFWQTPCILE